MSAVHKLFCKYNLYLTIQIAATAVAVGELSALSQLELEDLCVLVWVICLQFAFENTCN